MNKLARAFRAAKAAWKNQTSDLKNPHAWMLNTLLGNLSSASGITVNKTNALGVSTVYACVNVISRAMASMPVKLYRNMPDGSKREIVDDVRADMLRASANDQITAFDFRMAMQANLTLHNNAYAQIRRNLAGSPMELVPIEPSEISDIRQDDQGNLTYIVGSTPYEQKNILHLKGVSFTGLMGSDLLRTAREAIGLAIALETSAGSFFKNGQRPGLIAKHPASLSDQAFNRLQKDLDENHAGASNAFKFLLLEEGLDIVSNRQTNQESQFSETRKDQALEIARFFGVPPHKVGIESNLPRANVEEQNIEFVTDTLMSYCVLWEQQLNKWLLTKEERLQGWYFKFILQGLLRGAIQTRYEAYAKGIQWGWFSPNDVRRMEDLDPRKDGDIYLQPTNMIESGTQNQISAK